MRNEAIVRKIINIIVMYLEIKCPDQKSGVRKKGEEYDSEG